MLTVNILHGWSGDLLAVVKCTERTYPGSWDSILGLSTVLRCRSENGGVHVDSLHLPTISPEGGWGVPGGSNHLRRWVGGALLGLLKGWGRVDTWVPRPGTRRSATRTDLKEEEIPRPTRRGSQVLDFPGCICHRNRWPFASLFRDFCLLAAERCSQRWNQAFHTSKIGASSMKEPASTSSCDGQGDS